MLLDIPTMFVALFCAFALFGGSLTLARPFVGDRLELKLWAVATWCLVAGFITLAVRRVAPEWIAVLGGNAFVFVSLYLTSQALHRFVLHRPAPAWQLGLMLLGCACTIAAVDLPLYLRTTILSSLFALQVIPNVVLIARHAWRAEASLRTVGLTLAFTVLALIVRAADALIDPTQFNSYFQASLGNSLTYLACFLFPLGAGFGFVLANLERMAHRLDRLASFDTLTGCLSRAVFDTTLIRAIQQAYREREGLALINLDLDHFKQINDTHGHLAGDRVLRSVAAALRDRLSLGQVLGRLGGDEFGIILPQTDGISAIRLAEELRQMVESLEIRDPAGVALRISLSIGVSSVAPGTQPTLEALYLEADRALYEAKFRGRNRTQHFEPIGVQGAPPQNASFGVATSPGARREPMQVGPAA